jgi:bacterioferritin
MRGDSGVIDYLNKGLRSELTAVSQYWLHYRLQENWGLQRLAEKSRKESIEEMHHADKFIDRIIFLEGHPNLQTLDPLRIGENPKETLECDLAGELDAIALYKEVKDFVSKNLFEELLTDEEGHTDFLETQLDLIARIGVENWSQLNALPTDEVK